MNILYATDGSDSAATAGRLLSQFSLPTDARVTVLSVVPESGWIDAPSLGAEVSSPLIVEVRAEEEAAARRAAESAATALRERSAAVTIVVRHGSPPDAILDQARTDGVGLIVVGSHGMGVMERFLVGSVSERVARYADCSVLVARGDSLGRALLGVDDSESADQALNAFADLPLPAGVEVTVLTVVPPTVMLPPPPIAAGLDWETVINESEQERRAAGQRIVHRAQDRLRVAGRTTTTDVRFGSPADELVAAARETGADLLVVGSENRSALGRLFLGSVSSRVLSHAPCSVLVARTPEQTTGETGAS
jgi:nucleotide-binding universal stress UspA family protein